MLLIPFAIALFFAGQVSAVPQAAGVSTAAAAQPTDPYASDDPNEILWYPDSDIIPEPIRGTTGAPMLGPHNVPLELQNADLLTPPSTDNGDLGSLKWPFALSHNRLQTGGWARQQNINQLPVATDLAGVNMRLEAGAIRELHWHTAAEWAYVLSGNVRITTVTADGQSYIGDTAQGDLWYFPAGVPHSLQALGTDEGAEFLLIFDSGDFNEDSTFLLTDWLAHTPKEVLAKNFGVDISAFNDIPSKELYIFPSTSPPANIEDDWVVPNDTPLPYTYAFSNVTPTQAPGGTYKIADSTVFNISQTVAVAEVTVEVGGMREIHWHPTEPEWAFYISGYARLTAFGSSSNAITWDFEPGDISYMPPSYGHYVENIGNTTLHFLEIFKTNIYEDVSLNQWLALTPPAMVAAHLGVDEATIAKMTKTKQVVV